MPAVASSQAALLLASNDDDAADSNGADVKATNLEDIRCKSVLMHTRIVG